jgi:hypothetical protein
MRIARTARPPSRTPDRAAGPGTATADRETRAAYGRYLARRPQTLKEKVEDARRTDPKGYVLKAVQGMDPGKYSFSERVAEITWRIIWMFLPERTNNTLVRADTTKRGAELSPSLQGGLAEIVIGPDFIANLNADNLDLRINMLKIVVLGKERAEEKLKQEFGFAEVKDTMAEWTVGELAETYAGLKRMPQADLAALAGVTLRRDSQIVEHGEHFAGEFEWRLDRGDPPELDQILKLAGDTFTDPDTAAMIVVHEAGHAVENNKQRRTALASNVAVTAFNKTVDPFNSASTAATHAINAALTRASHYQAADKSAATGFINAVKAAHAAINAFGGGSATTGAAARERAADNAVKARNTARANLPSGNPADSDFARVCDLQDEFLTAARAFIAGKAASDAARATANAAHGQQAGHHDWSLRLERFVKVVNDHHIAPITPYAAKNWPGHPEEFYAEAYTMWVNNPKQLEHLAKPLKEYFDAAEQRR